MPRKSKPKPKPKPVDDKKRVIIVSHGYDG